MAYKFGGVTSVLTKLGPILQSGRFPRLAGSLVLKTGQHVRLGIPALSQAAQPNFTILGVKPWVDGWRDRQQTRSSPQKGVDVVFWQDFFVKSTLLVFVWQGGEVSNMCIIICIYIYIHISTRKCPFFQWPRTCTLTVFCDIAQDDKSNPR